MAAGDVKAGGAFVELFVKGLAPSQSQIQQFGAGLTKIGTGIAAIGATIAAPLVAAVSHFVAVGGAIDDVAQRTGMARTELAQLQYAGDQVGASLNDVERAMLNAQRKGDGRSFDQMAAEIAAIEDPAQRVQAAFELWGKSGAKLIPLVDNLRALKAEARSLGIGLSEQDIKNADELGDIWAKIKMQVSATAQAVGAALAPTLITISAAVSSIIRPVTLWIHGNRTVVITMAAIAAGLVVVGTILAGVGAGFVALSAAIAAVGAALPVLLPLAAPLGIAALAALGLALQLALIGYTAYRIAPQIRAAYAELMKLPFAAGVVKGAFASWGGVLGGVGKVASKAITGIRHEMSGLQDEIRKQIAAFQDYIDELMKANEQLSFHAQLMGMLLPAMQRRRQLVQEFATPEERAAQKEQQLLAAIKEVIRTRDAGFLTQEEAMAEVRALQIALHRHRVNEAERRANQAELRKPLPGAGAGIGKEPPPEKEKPLVAELPSTVAQTAAAALALTHGGARAGWQDIVAELRELRKQSVRQHEEAVRALRGGRFAIQP